MTSKRKLTLEDTFNFMTVIDARLSPDAQLVAFVSGETAVRDAPRPRSNVWVVPSGGGEPRRFTTGTTSDVAPQWSPDGQALAFLSDRDGAPNIHVMDADGSNVIRLTDNAALAGFISTADLAWSPDGTMLAFASNPDGNFDVFLVNADGSGLTQLTNNPASDGFDGLAWSPVP